MLAFMKCKVALIAVGIFGSSIIISAESLKEAATDPTPRPIPDHIVVTWNSDPATSFSVTWRTDTTAKVASGQIALADASPNFVYTMQEVQARTENLVMRDYAANYHSVTFTGLKPASRYCYRVGSKDRRSEWFQITTAAAQPKKFAFIFMGDGQSNLLSLWSRSIREAYRTAPDARFIIHGGDIVTESDSFKLWHEWFTAAGWINAVLPVLLTPGNHDYFHRLTEKRYLTNYWRPQFTLPENGLPELPESNYYVDYQGVRILILNSNERITEQARWLETVLSNNPNRWTVAAFHHPIYSAARMRDQKEIRQAWNPLFEKFHVDLVLNGHDHTYARGHNIGKLREVVDTSTGPVYVVSVSGPKQYELTGERWMERAAENTQLFQVVTVATDTLELRTFTTDGQLYDEFQLVKTANGLNKFIEKKPATPERRFENTLRSEKK